MKYDPKKKIDIEYEFDFVRVNTLDELINYFQEIKNRFNEREDILEQTIEFDYDIEGDRPYFIIYTTRSETDKEKVIREELDRQIEIKNQIKDLDQLKTLMDKYPQEISKWLNNNHKK